VCVSVYVSVCVCEIAIESASESFESDGNGLNQRWEPGKVNNDQQDTIASVNMRETPRPEKKESAR